NDPWNPQQINVPNLLDRAVFRQNTRLNLDGTQRQVFSFQEVFTGDKGFNQTFIRKDINPNTPSVVGGNRDVLDFPLWFAMRGNFTGDGTRNNFFNVRTATQNAWVYDSANTTSSYINPGSRGFVNMANNGGEAVAFVINH